MVYEYDNNCSILVGYGIVWYKGLTTVSSSEETTTHRAAPGQEGGGKGYA